MDLMIAYRKAYEGDGGMIVVLYCSTSIAMGVIAWIIIAFTVQAAPYFVVATFFLPRFIRYILPGAVVNNSKTFFSIAKHMFIGVYVFLVIGSGLIAILELSVPWPISVPRPEKATGVTREINVFMQNAMVVATFMFAFFLSLSEKTLVYLRQETLPDIFAYFGGVAALYIYIIYLFQNSLVLFISGVPVFQVLFDSGAALIASAGFAVATRVFAVRLLRS